MYDFTALHHKQDMKEWTEIGQKHSQSVMRTGHTHFGVPKG